jgi:hypothetical protein
MRARVCVGVGVCVCEGERGGEGVHKSRAPGYLWHEIL